jgi:hypothetical protein
MTIFTSVTHVSPLAENSKHASLLICQDDYRDLRYVTGRDFGSKLRIPERTAGTHLCVIYLP